MVAQNCPAWELIIVGDGSTDDTLEVFGMYDDPRIVVLRHNDNREVTAT